MGAFHEGHLALMRECKSKDDYCVVSLFVNPTQFGPSEDFARYPRNELRDFELAESAGVDFMFVPAVDEIYGDDEVWVEVGNLGKVYEGAFRPAHFRGVATVVLKLFEIVCPQAAYFGLKDLQQCAVINELVRAFKLPIALHFVETIRESDGLAMSSRNAYLTPEERQRAHELYRALQMVLEVINGGGGVSKAIETAKWMFRNIEFDYLDVVDMRKMAPISTVDEFSRVIAAARFGSVRLIDNCPVRT